MQLARACVNTASAVFIISIGGHLQSLIQLSGVHFNRLLEGTASGGMMVASQLKRNLLGTGGEEACGVWGVLCDEGDLGTGQGLLPDTARAGVSVTPARRRWQWRQGWGVETGLGSM